MMHQLTDVNGVSVLQITEHPIPVVVKNFSDHDAKPPMVRSTSLHTYVLDSSNASVTGMAQIATYEPRRYRTIIQVLDAPVALTLETPRKTPDIASVAAGPDQPQGRVLPSSTSFEYILYGPDAFWLNTITGSTATRVTVTKEYA